MELNIEINIQSVAKVFLLTIRFIGIIENCVHSESVCA